MLCICVITLALVGYSVEGAALPNNSENLIDIKDRLAKTIEKKCLKNADEDTYEEVLDELNSLSNTCWNSIVPNKHQSPESMTEHCREHIPDVVECLTRFLEKLKPCLEAEENYLKQFILDGYEKYSHYFCDHVKVISVIELEKTQTAQCVAMFKNEPTIHPKNVCYAKSKIFGDHLTSGVITKSELCQDMNSLGSCYEDMLDKHCPNAPEFKEFTIGRLGEALIQCSEE